MAGELTPEYPAQEIDPGSSGGSSSGGGRSSRSRNPLGGLWKSKSGRFVLAIGAAVVMLVMVLARRAEPAPEPEAPADGELTPASDDPFAGTGGSGYQTQPIPPGGFMFQDPSGLGGGGGYHPDPILGPVDPTPITVIIHNPGREPDEVSTSTSTPAPGPGPSAPVEPAPAPAPAPAPPPAPPVSTPGPAKPTAPVREEGFYRDGLGAVVYYNGKNPVGATVTLTAADRSQINNCLIQVRKTGGQRFTFRNRTHFMNAQGSFAPA